MYKEHTGKIGHSQMYKEHDFISIGYSPMYIHVKRTLLYKDHY